jgi:hypothetical protein
MIHISRKIALQSTDRPGKLVYGRSTAAPHVRKIDPN